MKTKAIILSTGLAMFSMFFGSGNLVFPLLVGQECQGHYLLASFGILLTGVLVPFLGILAMLLFNGDPEEFFARLGKSAIFWVPLLALSLMGPFGVLARCITVAHGAAKLVFEDLPLSSFSAASCLIIFLLTISKNRILPLIGSTLTPILLGSLSLIVAFSLYQADLPVSSQQGHLHSFTNGLFQGYQTMDLLAAFFFSSFVIGHIKKTVKESPLAIFFQSALIGASLLAIVYVALVLLGAIYSAPLQHIAPEEMLGFVAKITLGNWAIPIVCTTVILTCFTTALVLTSLFADFMRKEVFPDKLNSPSALALTLVLAFWTSTLKFSGIASILGPILEVLYPAMIVFTILNILYKLRGWNTLRTPIFFAFALKLFSSAI